MQSYEFYVGWRGRLMGNVCLNNIDSSVFLWFDSSIDFDISFKSYYAPINKCSNYKIWNN